jgi:hypothetical protein
MKSLFRKRIFRLGLLLALPFLLFFAFLIGYRWHISEQSNAALREITQKLDQTDPGWRWEEILTNQKTLPADTNSYFVVQRLLPQPRPSPMALLRMNTSNLPIERSWALPGLMPPEQADWAGEFVEKNSEKLLLARSLVNYPEGRPLIAYTHAILDTISSTERVPFLQGAELLRWDARVACQMGNLNQAIEDIRALRNLARAFNHADGFGSCLSNRRMGLSWVVYSLEELLANSEPNGKSLVLLEEELLEESLENQIVPNLKFQRALCFEAMKDFERIMLILGITNGDLKSRLLPYKYGAYAERDQAAYLQEMTALIEKCKNPEYELLDVQKSYKLSHADIKQWPECETDTLLCNLLFYQFETMNLLIVGDLLNKAELRCAATAIAAERFRQDHNRWPEKLDQLVPQYLKSVPRDPFVDEPLKFRQLKDGVFIYYNDRGAFLRPPESNGKPADLGIKLWNPELRRH